MAWDQSHVIFCSLCIWELGQQDAWGHCRGLGRGRSFLLAVWWHCGWSVPPGGGSPPLSPAPLIQGERPRSARTRSSIDREIQSGTYLTLHRHFLPLGTDSSWLCHKRTLRYQQTLGLSFPNNPLALLAILQGGILRPLRFSFLVLNNEAPGGELSPGYS